MASELQGPASSAWSPAPEKAPSVFREEEPRVARWVGTIGVFLAAVGILALGLHLAGKTRLIGPGAASLSLVLGLGCMLFHAAVDADLQVRRTYGVFGFAWLVFGLVMSAIPASGGAGTYFVPFGFIGLLLGLFFLMPFVRNETEDRWRRAAVLTVGALALLMALVGLVGGHVSGRFLLPYGLLLAVLGLLYGWAFVGMEGAATDTGYRAGLLMGALGTLSFLVSLGLSVLPPLFYRWHWLSNRPDYFVPTGLLLMGLGIVYLTLSLGLCWDNRFVVMTRRELASYFYSPIAYIVLFCMTVIGLWNYFQWAGQFFLVSVESSAVFAEPILQRYIISWWPVIVMIVIVPLLTMSLLSEEKRTGTLEVLLTAPVGEAAIVLSKFLAAFIFFFIAFVPWWLFLVAFRVEVGQPFEYRPLLSFGIALACTGAGFLAMGEFFSAISRNQIVAFILGFAGMLGLLSIFFIKMFLQDKDPTSEWLPILGQASYVDLWWTAMEGVLAPRYLVFHVSAAIFWLFLAVKVLESRKWR